MTTETLLFIGGGADGSRRQVNARDSVVSIVKMVKGRALYTGPMFADSEQSSVIEREYYERAMLECYYGTPPNGTDDKIHFFRIQGMTEIDAVRRLIECYKP